MPPVTRRKADMAALHKHLIVTYNVLSAKLCDAKSMPRCTPEACDPSKRYERIIKKLNDQALSKRAIIGLQEVPRQWTGKFATFFAGNDYFYLDCSYGNDHNDYMGVGIAVPRDLYSVEDCQVVRLSDTKKWVKSKPPPVSYLGSIINYCYQWVPFLSSNTKPPADIFDLAMKRYNAAILARLMCTRSKQQFCFATYHMPCMYRDPAVMVLHTSLLGNHARRFAINDPLILAGDFNFKPDSSQYQLMTTGTLEKTHPEYPRSPLEPDYDVTLSKPLVSAYAKHSKEPLFTNYSLIMLPWEKADREPFSGCLDYIFVDDDRVNVVDVMPLPESLEEVGILPTVEEPSDHLMIGATVVFTN